MTSSLQIEKKTKQTKMLKEFNIDFTYQLRNKMLKKGGNANQKTVLG